MALQVEPKVILTLVYAEAAMTSPCLGVGNGYPWSFLIAGAMVIVSLAVENTLKGFMFR